MMRTHKTNNCKVTYHTNTGREQNQSKTVHTLVVY